MIIIIILYHDCNYHHHNLLVGMIMAGFICSASVSYRYMIINVECDCRLWKSTYILSMKKLALLNSQNSDDMKAKILNIMMMMHSIMVLNYNFHIHSSLLQAFKNVLDKYVGVKLWFARAHWLDEIASDTNFFKEIGPASNLKMVNYAKFISEAFCLNWYFHMWVIHNFVRK